MWACCPKRLRGANLVQVFGQCLGLTPYTVEIKNIVAGDLPYESSHGDFYLVVENAANPPMMSSLAEEKHPKVVHFPEVITIRLRWSHLEESLRITVRELNIVGSRDVCFCRIDPMHILDWCDDPNERIKRFEMKPVDHNTVFDTPAWILLEFDHPTEARDLENFHGSINTVRTSTRDGHYKDTPLDRFKRDYMLLDNNGHAMDEIPEEDLREIQRLKACAFSGFHFLNLVTVAVVVAYTSTRAYLASCYKDYRWLTTAYKSGVDFPIGVHALKRLALGCKAKVARDGAALGSPCRPTTEDILGLCRSNATGGHFPGAQDRPTAFGDFARQRLGLKSQRRLRLAQPSGQAGLLLHCHMRRLGGAELRLPLLHEQHSAAEEARQDPEEARAHEKGAGRHGQRGADRRLLLLRGGALAGFAMR
eukprot:CAMPEP_0171211462 /NCGR_PEP_ID=MMETSP0790-20130122/29635_1 /TAXON_ID=2925 /ORGANISM="Alexandrium catenella, Strain OF101" /LENGTH=420 /DNA_ID=CAMNT_0011677127 /DNA_START=100 /DNA_END=1358 /DNA_ORIENTATION=+